MTASVSFVPLILAILNAKCGTRKQKMPMGNDKDGHSRAFCKSETLTSNSFRSLDYARGNESIIYFTDLCKPKNTFASYPAAKHPNAINLRLQIYDKRSVNFWITPRGRRL